MKSMSSVVVTLGPLHREPWWWSEIQADPELCDITYRRIVFENKTSREITGMQLPLFLLRMLPTYLGLRRRYEYMFTFECDLTTFALAFWQTLLLQRRPRHVVLQFIMREKTKTLASRLKYAAMRWVFSSLHLAVCSATREVEYYLQAFSWPSERAVFVPFHTTRTLLDGDTADDGYLLAAGRTLRDYPTLVEALHGSQYQAVVVAGRDEIVDAYRVPRLVVYQDIHPHELDRLMRGASVVILPLVETRLSTGQMVLLHAMALGKPVIATRTTGVIDYIVDGREGVLVPAGDAPALRFAIDGLMGDVPRRRAMGARAKQAVLARHLPHHYTQFVREVLRS